jgi:predicted PurR-regulated permease PerM
VTDDRSESPKTETEMPAWPQEGPAANRVGAARNGMPVAALTTGILSLIAILLLKSLPIAVLLAVVSIALGIMGLRQVKRGIADRRGFALAGLILGVVGLILSVVLLILSYRVYNDCKHKIGHSPSQKELTTCVNDKK